MFVTYLCCVTEDQSLGTGIVSFQNYRCVTEDQSLGTGIVSFQNYRCVTEDQSLGTGIVSSRTIDVLRRINR
jgi:hypothetical protein